MSDYDDEPVQEKIKAPRKKRELTDEQRKIMLANLEKGRKKRHENMRSKKPTQEKPQEKPQVKDDEDIPYDKTLSEPVKSTDNNNVIAVKEPEKPKKIKKKPRQIIYEKEESDTDNDEPVIVRRVKKQPQRQFSKPQYTETPPQPPRLMRSNQDIEELKKQQEIKKKKQEYENFVRKTLNNFFI